MKPSEWKPPVIAVIGMGAGPQWLGGLALEWIGAAQILAGSARHLAQFDEHTGEKLFFKSPLSDSVEEIGRVSNTRRIAVICSGDPLFFGIGKTLAKRFGGERLVIIPNISSVQTLCAAICEPWDSAEAVSFHGQRGEGDMERVLEILQRGRKAAVLTDPQHTPQWIARELIQRGESQCRLIIGEDLGTESERVRSFLPSEAACLEFSPLNVLLVKPGSQVAGADLAGAPQRVFGFTEDAFERDAGMITKMEVRAVVLASLQLEQGQVLWDLGAATGSVSIEAARIARLQQVFAIEKAPARHAKLLRNLEKFGASRVKAICAEASGALAALPSPHRVFIGGSGADLGAILDTVSQRLLPDGIVVQTAVLLQTLERSTAFWKNQGFEVSIVQLQVNRSVPTGKELRLEALNPVFILSARRKCAG
ncbi:MAG: precorrin-6y C5,15-methyltransferase (decarboxylating) subunit CbiE [Syntrophobacteraceae bacterium]|nr:precorrin-6y C5,15-methyltransferase (decarboxylating) subunit CbiE [Syntrophobacteraceae bacterium]